MKNCFILKLQDDPARFPQIAIADLTPEMVPGTWTITRINVPLAHRGRGYGSKLLREILDTADTDGVTLSLEILPSGPLDYEALRSWYYRYGFRPSARYAGIFIRRPRNVHTPQEDTSR